MQRPRKLATADHLARDNPGSIVGIADGVFTEDSDRLKGLDVDAQGQRTGDLLFVTLGASGIFSRMTSR